MKRLAGNDIIVLMKAAVSDGAVLKEAQSLTKDDFNHEDIIVNYFFNAFPDGFNSMDKTASNKINVLENVQKQVVNHGLRKAFSNLQNFRGASNEAITLENQVSEYFPSADFESQLKTAKLLTFLSKYSVGENNRQQLKEAAKDVNASDFKSAANKVHSVFARLNPASNVRTAFVTIKQQIGEGYQMCPKAIYQSGKPIPMAISDCREYCIDVRHNPDGTVGCNYLKWLNENLMTQEQAKNLFDTMPYGSDYETMNLEDKQRSKFPMSDQDSQDQRMYRKPGAVADLNKPWEEKLETQHKGYENPDKRPHRSIASDKALEVLLKDVRDVFDDDELDSLAALLEEQLGE